MKSTRIFSIAAALAISGGDLSGQTVPAIQFDSNPTPLTMPDNIHLGEAAGVATNSKGDIFVYTRTGNPTITLGTARAVSHGGGRAVPVRSHRQVRARDRPGHLRIPAGAAGARRSAGQHLGRRSDVDAGDQVRSERPRADDSEPQAGSDAVPAPRLTPLPDGIPIDSAGAARRWRPQAAAPAACWRTGATAGRRGRRARASSGRPMSPGTRRATSTSPTATATRAWRSTRRNGKWLKNWGSRGTGQGQFNIVHGIAIDAQGNVYVADEGNKRVQVFDTEGTFKTQFTNVGAPTALCLTPRAAAGALRRAHRRSRRHGRRGDLQGRPEGQRRRQVRQRRQAAEGVRPGEFDRLPQRERAARRRARELAGPEDYACAPQSRFRVQVPGSWVRRKLKGMRRTLFALDHRRSRLRKPVRPDQPRHAATAKPAAIDHSGDRRARCAVG